MKFKTYQYVIIIVLLVILAVIIIAPPPIIKTDITITPVEFKTVDTTPRFVFELPNASLQNISEEMERVKFWNESDGYCDAAGFILNVPLYSSEVCNLICNGVEFRITMNVPENMAIEAQIPYAEDCLDYSFKCWGKFEGYLCPTTSWISHGRVM